MSKPTCLTLGNSTVYGLDHVGVLTYLEENSMLSGINTIMSSSSSSFIGLMLVLGYKVSDIMTFCLELRRECPLHNMSLLRSGHLLNVKILKEKLFDVIFKKVSIVPTFRELYDLFPVNYTAVAYSVTEAKTIYFNRKLTPDVSILDGVIASCAVQFLYGAYTIGEHSYLSGINSNPYPHVSGDVNGIGICYDYNDLFTESLKGETSIISQLPLLFVPIQELINKSIKSCKNYQHIRITGVGYVGDWNTVTKAYKIVAPEEKC